MSILAEYHIRELVDITDLGSKNVDSLDMMDKEIRRFTVYIRRTLP